MARTPKVVQDRRQQIIESAIRVFAQKGFARATNKDIAHEAGITPGLIYHYFESKEALLKAVIETHTPAQVMRSLPPQMVVLPPEAMLSSLVRQILQIIESEEFVQILRAFLPEVIHNPKIAPLGIEVIQQATKVLEGYLAARMESGELRRADPILATQIIMGSVMALVLRRQVLRDPIVLQYTHEQIAESVITTTLRGLLPR